MEQRPEKSPTHRQVALQSTSQLLKSWVWNKQGLDEKKDKTTICQERTIMTFHPPRWNSEKQKRPTLLFTLKSLSAFTCCNQRSSRQREENPLLRRAGHTPQAVQSVRLGPPAPERVSGARTQRHRCLQVEAPAASAAAAGWRVAAWVWRGRGAGAQPRPHSRRPRRLLANGQWPSAKETLGGFYSPRKDPERRLSS